MKPPLIIFLCVLSMAGALLVAMAIGETPVSVTEKDGAQMVIPIGHGIQHSEFKTMLSGADGEARHSRLLWLGWAFGLSQIVLFVAMLSLGMTKHGGLGRIRTPLIIGGGVFAIIFTLLILTYREYMLGESSAFFLGFPSPTAWMVFGIWIFPVFFVVLYMRAFDSWTFTDADRKRFDELLAKAKREPHGGPEGN